MTDQMYHLIQGWRGYLVGPRRVWHPYHYFALAGYRAGWLLVRPAAQTGQLVRAAGLLGSIFARGGRAWGFGVGFRSGTTLWGRVWPDWLPGQITNCVYYRARQAFLLQRARAGLTPYSTRLVRRVRYGRTPPGAARLWGAAPRGRTGLFLFEADPQVDPLVGQDEITPLPEYSRRVGWSNTVKARFVRLVTRPVLTRVARQTGRLERGLGRSTQSAATTAAVVAAKLADRRSRVIHGMRPFRRRVQAERPPRPARQYQTQPFGFPSVVIAAGTGSNRGLLSEAANLGVPAVYFAPAGFSPGLTPFGVVWGTHRRQPFGVSALVDLVHRQVWTTLLVQTVWARLR